MDGTVPFRSSIQIVRFLPFQNGGKAIFTAETVTQQNGLIFAKQALVKGDGCNAELSKNGKLFIGIRVTRPYRLGKVPLLLAEFFSARCVQLTRRRGDNETKRSLSQL